MADSSPYADGVPAPEAGEREALTLRDEFLYRIRTALTYGLMRGKHGEQIAEGWAEREADSAVLARRSQPAPRTVTAEDLDEFARVIFDADYRHGELPGDAPNRYGDFRDEYLRYARIAYGHMGIPVEPTP